MPITPQERELVIIGAAVASGCKPCIRRDMLVANQLHVSDKDISDTIAVAIDIRQRATDSVKDFVSSGLVDSMEPEPVSAGHQNPRNRALVSVSAAFAVNCVSGVKKQIAAAREIGIDTADLHAVVSLSSFIKAMAISHVERLMSPVGIEDEDESNTLAEYGTPFGPERCAWAEVCKSEAAAYRDSTRSLSADDLIGITGAL